MLLNAVLTLLALRLIWSGVTNIASG
jgi:hypothetical protein